jgi:hypothetical protein
MLQGQGKGHLYMALIITEYDDPHVHREILERECSIHKSSVVAL